jgi:hypothetical protein
MYLFECQTYKHLYTHTGDSYEGQYKSDQLHGVGSYAFRNGDRYVGAFADGDFDGYGVLYSSEGKVLKKGFWKGRKLVEEK